MEILRQKSKYLAGSQKCKYRDTLADKCSYRITVKTKKRTDKLTSDIEIFDILGQWMSVVIEHSEEVGTRHRDDAK